MELQYTQQNGIVIATLISNQIEIHNAQDALDVMMTSAYSGAEKLIIYQYQLSPDFFDLKTGLAGEVLQKVSNYRMQLAIIGGYDNINSKALNDFIYESNKTGRVIFVETLETAFSVLSQ